MAQLKWGSRVIRCVRGAQLFFVIWGCRDGTPIWNTYQYEICPPTAVGGFSRVGVLVWDGWVGVEKTEYFLS